MSVILYPDQEESINKLRDSMRRHKRVLLRGETGSGKSVMAAYMISGCLEKKVPCAFVVPRKELLSQMSETFDSFDIPHSFVASGNPFNPKSLVHLCTIGTLCNRIDRINPKIIFIDEAHYGSGQLDKIISRERKYSGWVIGLSATPEKANGDGLDRWYDDMVEGKNIRDLIDLKRLSDYRYFAPSKPDLSSIKIVDGEYSKSQLSGFMEENRVLTGDAVRHYKQNALGKLNMTFCTSIKHSQEVADTFRNAGIPSVHMDGETPENERRKIARAFARHEIINLCSVDLVLFGYDLASASGIKSACVESISDLRPTKSRPLQRQKIGRALRYKDSPAIILDHAANSDVHGLPDDNIEWSLSGRKKKKRSNSEKAPPTVQCMRCFHVFRPAPVCPECGMVREIKGRDVEEVDGELEEIRERNIAKIKRMEVGKARTMDQLKTIARERGYKSGWVFKQAQIKGIKS